MFLFIFTRVSFNENCLIYSALNKHQMYLSLFIPIQFIILVFYNKYYLSNLINPKM